MPKGWTDAEYVVVKGPKRDPLPDWFKAIMLILATVIMLSMGVMKVRDLHGSTAPQAGAEAGATGTQPAPDAR